MKYYVSANCHFDSVQEAASDKEEVVVSVQLAPGTYTSTFQSRFLPSKSQSKFQLVL